MFFYINFPKSRTSFRSYKKHQYFILAHHFSALHTILQLPSWELSWLPILRPLEMNFLIQAEKQVLKKALAAFSETTFFQTLYPELQPSLARNSSWNYVRLFHSIETWNLSLQQHSHWLLILFFYQSEHCNLTDYFTVQVNTTHREQTITEWMCTNPNCSF